MSAVLWKPAKERKKKLKKMELIYILNVMIIINGKFNFTHTQIDTPKGLPHQLGRVLNVIVRETSGDKFLEVYNKESQQAKK